VFCCDRSGRGRPSGPSLPRTSDVSHQRVEPEGEPTHIHRQPVNEMCTVTVNEAWMLADPPSGYVKTSATDMPEGRAAGQWYTPSTWGAESIASASASTACPRSPTMVRLRNPRSTTP
jgi:hypothetical protein